MLCIHRTTFYRWYDLDVEKGLDGLTDRTSEPKPIWNRIPQDRRDGLIELALDYEASSPRELAVKCTDEKCYFSQSYRLTVS